ELCPGMAHAAWSLREWTVGGTEREQLNDEATREVAGRIRRLPPVADNGQLRRRLEPSDREKVRGTLPKLCKAQRNRSGRAQQRLARTPLRCPPQRRMFGWYRTAGPRGERLRTHPSREGSRRRSSPSNSARHLPRT